MAHHTRTTNTFEETLAIEFDRVMSDAEDARTVQDVLDKLRIAQALRTKADNVGCDGDLLYEKDGTAHAVNIVQKLMELVDDGGWMNISDFDSEDCSEPDSYDMQLAAEERALSMEKVA